MENTNHNKTTFSLVSSFHSNAPPPRGTPAYLPASAGDAAVACDGCERVCHVSGDVVMDPDDEFTCEECFSNGVVSKRWPLGSTKKKRRFSSGWSGDVSDFRLQKASGYSTQEDELGFEDTSCDKDLVDMGASHVENDGATDSLFLQFSDVLPVQYKDFCVLSLGQVDRRPSYHTKNQIWPVGYRSCWHDKVTGSLFVCDVLDGGERGPVFKVRRSSCSTLTIASGSTIFVVSNHGLNKAGSSFDEEENSSFQMLISDPPTENDSLCCLENPPISSAASDSPIWKDEIGEFSVEESSPVLVWRNVAKKFVETFREIYTLRNTLNFCCEHVFDEKDEESCTSLAKFSGSPGAFKAPSIDDDRLKVETFFEGLRTWLDQDRFGLEVEFVQEIIEFLPGVGACTQYTPLKKRSCYTSSVLVGNGVMLVKTKDGKQMKGEEALRSLFGTSKKANAESVQDHLMNSPNLPMGEPLCTMFPPEIVGDAIQVLEFFRRFSEVLYIGDSFTEEQLEMELSSPFFAGHGNSNITTSSTSALDIAHMSLLNILNSELQAKVCTEVDPSSDVRDSKPKRGRKKSVDLSVPIIGKNPNMLPLNELTWPELIRRYLLAMLSMDDNIDTFQSGKVFRCLFGDGGELCGSLIGVLGMEADALLLAQAMKKIFGLLEMEYDMLTVDDEGTDKPSACQSSSTDEGNIPEWAQLLEPVRKLPTNVGARIRKCVYAALDKCPPEWAKKLLENSISKEVYKGNACGPTKRAVISVLTTVCGEGDGQKPVKGKKKPAAEIKGRKYVSISDIIMRQCRIILRQVANADGKKAFCNLLSRRLSHFVESEDEGFLGCPANVSRPIDFRSIDLRLVVGAYDGSHEAFLEDVHEFWNYVRISCVEKPDLLRLADSLSSKFEELYEKEVLAIYHKLAGYAKLGCLSEVAKKEVDELIVSSSVLPKAPWETNICKICGIDKNDKLVLLCDTCDAEYHTYCLNPRLTRVPHGNWHCPSCVSKQDSGNGMEGVFANLDTKRKSLGEFTGVRSNSLTQLASLLEDKDYWEIDVKERTLLLKFLTDELLNSSSIRRHLEPSMEASSDVQQKLRSAYNELKNMKQKKEKIDEKIAKTSKASPLEPNQLYENTSTLPQSPVDITLGDSSEYTIELNSIKNGMMRLRDFIISLEMQLMNLSGRREFLGADSAGRLYWVSAKMERKPCVIVNDATKASCDEESTLSSQWVIFQSPPELEELLSFLREEDPVERELKGSISRRLKVRLVEGENEGSDENKTQNDFSGYKFSDYGSLATKAAGLLEKTYGRWVDLEAVLLNKKTKKAKVISDDNLFRCSCMELVLPSRYHCISCHKTFETKKEAGSHNDNQCKSGLAGSSQSKGDNSSKGDTLVVFPKLKNLENDGLVCPYDLDVICAKFVTMDSLKELVREIGLIGSNGVPIFLPNISPYLSDPTLKLNDNNGLLGSSSRGEPDDYPGSDKPEKKSTDKKDESSSGDKSCAVAKSAMKPLVGKASLVLIQLKMNLLDMEAALPKAALRVSKACIKRRWTWRSFVKSAETIDEMVQAVITFEDMVKAVHLKNWWWHWSSLSAAAKISSLSALALRIYSLDASIIYDES